MCQEVNNNFLGSLTYSNCVKNDPNFDFCEICEDGFINSNKNKECIKIPENCDIYSLDNTSTEAPYYICTTCSDNFYFDTEQKTCVQITIENCLIYDSTNSTCLRCANEFYKDVDENNISVCLPHDLSSVEGCLIYSNTVKNKCIYCGNNCSFLKNLSLCLLRNSSDLCEIYDQSGQNCISCFEGNFLDSNGECKINDQTKHCLISDNQNDDFCWSCKKSYLRRFSSASFNKSECVPVSNFSKQNCQEFDGKGNLLISRLFNMLSIIF